MERKLHIDQFSITLYGKLEIGEECFKNKFSWCLPMELWTYREHIFNDIIIIECQGLGVGVWGSGRGTPFQDRDLPLCIFTFLRNTQQSSKMSCFSILKTLPTTSLVAAPPITTACGVRESWHLGCSKLHCSSGGIPKHTSIQSA